MNQWSMEVCEHCARVTNLKEWRYVTLYEFCCQHPWPWMLTPTPISFQNRSFGLLLTNCRTHSVIRKQRPVQHPIVSNEEMDATSMLKLASVGFLAKSIGLLTLKLFPHPSCLSCFGSRWCHRGSLHCKKKVPKQTSTIACKFSFSVYSEDYAYNYNVSKICKWSMALRPTQNSQILSLK